jgi:hypothetical protein
MGITVMWARTDGVLLHSYYPDAVAYEMYAREEDPAPEDLYDHGALVLLDEAGDDVAVWFGNTELPDAITHGEIVPTPIGQVERIEQHPYMP